MTLNKREQQREERREQILACGLRMIVTRGYEATKIRDIADELGISIGLFFNYFESKETLYAELVKIGLEGPRSTLAMTNPGGSPLSLFEGMTEFIFSALRTSSDTGLFFILMTQAFRLENIPASVKALLADYDTISPLIPVIEAGQRDGSIKAGNPTALLVAYWGAVMGVAEMNAMNPNPILPEPGWIVDILKA
jgi:AcrR family transcriptional regulator